MSVKALRKKALMLLTAYGDLPVCVVIDNHSEDGVIRVAPCNCLTIRMPEGGNPVEDGIVLAHHDESDDTSPCAMTLTKLLEFTAIIKEQYDDDMPVIIQEDTVDIGMTSLLAVGVAETPDNMLPFTDNSPLIIILGHPDGIVDEELENETEGEYQ